MKAPWSNQQVSLVVRVGAGFYVAVGLIACMIAAYFTWLEGIPHDMAPGIPAILIVLIYQLALFAHVAYHGRAPAGWVPFRKGDLRQG